MKTRGKFRKDWLPQPTEYYRQEGLKLLGRGEWRTALCLFHDDRDPSLRINIVHGGFICNGCGKSGGHVLDFHLLRHGGKFVDVAQHLGAWEDDVFPAQTTASPKPLPRPQTKSDPVKDAARKIASNVLRRGYKPEALHVYRNAGGSPLYYKVRAKDPATGDKWIRPMHHDGKQFVPGEPKFSNGKPLYGLDLIALRPGELVVVCEGEKSADALRKRGVLAITSGGARSAETADWSPIAGRQVLVWPDHDAAGKSYADAVAARVADLGCRVSMIDTAALGVGEKEDAFDWLRRNPDARREDIFCLPQRRSDRTDDTDRHNGSDVPFIDPVVASAIAGWCVQRCTRSARVWGAVAALYRDYCDHYGVEVAVALGEFQAGLASVGIQVDSGFAVGLALEQDVRGLINR